MSRLHPLCAKSRGMPQIGDRKRLGGIKRVIRNRSCWQFAPGEYSPAKTINRCWRQRSDEGIVTPVPPGPAEQSNQADTLMKDARGLKSRRPAFSRRLKNKKRPRPFGTASSSLISKSLAVADAFGPLFHIHLSAGQTYSCDNAAILPNGPTEAVWIISDCEYGVNWCGKCLIDAGIALCFWSLRERILLSFANVQESHRCRHRMDYFVARVKNWAPSATSRYDSCPKVHLSSCFLAVVIMYLLCILIPVAVRT